MQNDLDRSYRIGNPKTKKTKTPITVKFVRHNLRHNICNNKKLLKGKGFLITEKISKDLTKDRMAKLNEARETYGLVMAKYFLKMKRIFQANPLSTMINFCDNNCSKVVLWKQNQVTLVLICF